MSQSGLSDEPLNPEVFYEDTFARLSVENDSFTVVRKPIDLSGFTDDQIALIDRYFAWASRLLSDEIERRNPFDSFNALFNVHTEAVVEPSVVPVQQTTAAAEGSLTVLQGTIYDVLDNPGYLTWADADQPGTGYNAISAGQNAAGDASGPSIDQGLSKGNAEDDLYAEAVTIENRENHELGVVIYRTLAPVLSEEEQVILLHFINHYSTPCRSSDLIAAQREIRERLGRSTKSDSIGMAYSQGTIRLRALLKEALLVTTVGSQKLHELDLETAYLLVTDKDFNPNVVQRQTPKPRTPTAPQPSPPSPANPAVSASSAEKLPNRSIELTDWGLKVRFIEAQAQLFVGNEQLFVDEKSLEDSILLIAAFVARPKDERVRLGEFVATINKLTNSPIKHRYARNLLTKLREEIEAKTGTEMSENIVVRDVASGDPYNTMVQIKGGLQPTRAVAESFLKLMGLDDRKIGLYLHAVWR